MKMRAKIINVMAVSLIGLSFVSCTQEIQDAISTQQENPQGQNQGEDFRGGQNFGQFDEDYARAMNDNFGDYQMERDGDCFKMYDQNYQSRFELPQRRPTSRGQMVNNNPYGMGVDGSRISYGNSGWQFETSPYELARRTGGDRIIGVHRDGAPIYARYVGDYDQTPQLDQHGGRYAPTQDFPNGIYHYVITLNINNQ